MSRPRSRTVLLFGWRLMLVAGITLSLFWSSRPPAPVAAPAPPAPVETATAPVPMSFDDLAGLSRDSSFIAALRQIEEREGFRSHVYTDTISGAETIGYGFNVSAGIGEGLGRVIAAWQLADAHRRFEADWPPFSGFSGRIQWALAQVAFQLGVRGAERFHDELDAIQSRNVQAAVAAVRNSVWYNETPVRAEDLIRVLREDL